MRGLMITLALLATATAHADSLDALRADVERLTASADTEVEAEALAERAFALARDAGGRSAFLSALGLAAQIHAAAAPAAAGAIRARALDLSSGRFSDSRRWWTLTVEGFVPRLEALPREQWREALASYDALLAALRARHTDVRVRAVLRYAAERARLIVNERWDWLQPAQRAATVERLRALAAEHGSLPQVGVQGDPRPTFADLVTAGVAALERLHFGAPAPAGRGVDLDGRPLDLAAYRGRVVVLDFWTSFCLPCLALVPHTRAMLERLAALPVTVLGVNGDVGRAQGKATAERVGMTWPSFWDGPQGTAGPLATAWQVDGWPTLFVLDAEGRIRVKLHDSERIEAELEAAVRGLLAEIAASS